jgi:hypothetical protein
MKNIFLGNLMVTSLEEGRVSEIFKSLQLQTLTSMMQTRNIHQTVLFAMPEMRLALEELWMGWMQQDPKCSICIEYIGDQYLNCEKLKSSMQHYLTDIGNVRAWCFLDNYQSAPEAFQKALDALSEDLNYQIVWIDSTGHMAKEDPYHLPQLEEEDPYHWSIFEKIKILETEPIMVPQNKA